MTIAITGKLSITAELKIKDTVELNDGLLAIQKFCVDMNSEQGCFLAVAHQDNQDPRKVILWEIYRDQTAFDEHFKAEHTQAFIKEGLTDLITAYQTQPMATLLTGANQ
ncbi:antibiotic biosynthesis monooxygenase [Shewanella sp. GutCb]|uniref:putative quinol monooxygenase n=1 Tax=Shewanella sp. GutCb TaxID=2058315 RepID=UPI000C79E950|nr:antibiotic biosynthesis monooxygenase [Shewanella sp. GutCb]PKG76638.1 antibiotic biosynthesis monooxygenase [Shewanella sp. GutCb]